LFSLIFLVYFSALNDIRNMKKVYLLMGMLVMVSAAFAQRTIRLNFNVVSPPENYTINVGDAFSQEVVITNLGPDDIKPTDSLLYRDVTSDPNNTNIYFVLTGFTKGVNDTIMITKGLTLNTANQNGPTNYCVYGLMQNATDSIVIDSVYADCNQVIIAGVNDGGGGVSVMEFTSTTTNSSAVNLVFPNPVKDNVTFAISLAYNQNVSVKIFDLAGRLVIAEERVKMNKGDNQIQLNTNTLAPGLYLYQVTMGQETVSGKLNVSK
jgi:hypothetical protein